MKTSGEFLIFLLLLITNARVFFVESRKDAVVVLSPLAFFLSVFQIFSWGFDIFTGLAFLLSILVLFSNFHAIYRYFERLYVDHYSPLMYVWAIFTTLLCILSIIFLIVFMPSVPFTRGKASQSFGNLNFYSERYSGNFRSGFEKAGIFQKTSMRLNFFESNSEKPVMVFFPDKRAESYHYIPYLIEIANKGYSLVSSDFNANDALWLHNFCDARILRRFGMVISSLSDENKFNSQKEFYTYNSLLECNAVFQVLKKKYGENQKYIIVSDFMADVAVSDFKKSHENEIAGIIYLDQLAEYKTPGYGFVAQTDPLLITILGKSRDKDGSESRLAALKTVSLMDEIADSMKKKSDSEGLETENDS